MTNKAYQLIISSAAVSLILSPLAVWFANKIQLVDIPFSLPHKQHDRRVPLTGGCVLVLTTVIIGWEYIFVNNSPVLPLFVFSGIVFLFGLFDDFRNLPVSIKFLGQLIAAAGLLLTGISFNILPEAWTWLNKILTLLWIIGITNAFNFVDSMDGLSVGLAAIGTLFLGLIYQLFGQSGLSEVSAVLFGAALGLLFMNTKPARIFIGDSGSQWLGFMLAGLGMMRFPIENFRSATWFLPVLVLAVPIFDIVLVIKSRIRKHNKVYIASRDHTFHRLVCFGLDTGRAVLAMWASALILGLIALMLINLEPLWSNLFFMILLFIGAGIIIWMDSPGRWE